jgi:hypothetical protein
VRRICAGSVPGLRRCARSVRPVCAGKKNPERTTRSMGLAVQKLGVQVCKHLKKSVKNVFLICRTPLHVLSTLIFGCSVSNRNTEPGAGHSKATKTKLPPCTEKTRPLLQAAVNWIFRRPQNPNLLHGPQALDPFCGPQESVFLRGP